MVKYLAKGGEPVEWCELINPGIPISEEAMQVHGIVPKDLARKPTFQQYAQEILHFIGNADLAGYNSNRFDVPMLMEEFARVGIDFSMEGRRTIDVQRIFYKMEPRTLKAALKFYAGKSMENAHDALADVYATVDVLRGQLARYDGVDLEIDEGNRIEQPVKNDMQALHEFTNDLRYLDVTQKIKIDHNNVAVFNFGKYNGQPVAEVLAKDNNYYQWIMNKEFSTQMKKICQKLLKEYKQQQKR